MIALGGRNRPWALGPGVILAAISWCADRESCHLEPCTAAISAAFEPFPGIDMAHPNVYIRRTSEDGLRMRAPVFAGSIAA
jgi:hypothetical protein